MTKPSRKDNATAFCTRERNITLKAPEYTRKKKILEELLIKSISSSLNDQFDINNLLFLEILQNDDTFLLFF